MLNILISWLLMAVAFWVTALALPKVHLKKPSDAIWVAGLFGILNFFLGWLLFAMIGIGTAGIGFFLAFLTRWVVNTLILKLTDVFSARLKIDGWGTAFLASLMISGLSTVFQYVVSLVR